MLAYLLVINVGVQCSQRTVGDDIDDASSGSRQSLFNYSAPLFPRSNSMHVNRPRVRSILMKSAAWIQTAWLGRTTEQPLQKMQKFICSSLDDLWSTRPNVQYSLKINRFSKSQKVSVYSFFVVGRNKLHFLHHQSLTSPIFLRSCTWFQISLSISETVISDLTPF